MKGPQKLFDLLLVGINIASWVELVLSAESKYEACKPKNCGSGPNISYPFYIYEEEPDYCGHPGFEIRCENGWPRYKTSGADYIIQNITYESQSFRVVNAEVINKTCPSPLRNYSFDRSSVEFTFPHADIFFFYNCSTDLFSANYSSSVAPCDTNVPSKTFVALVPRDEDLNWTRTACQSLVSAPIELNREEINQTIRNVDYIKLLMDGFTLKWIGLGNDCGKCTASGGYCGFEEENGVCYCPDGTHRKHCNDEEGGNDTAKWLILAASAVGVGILIIAVYYCCARRLSSYKSKDDNSIEAFLKDNGSLAPKRYGYSEVKKMTQSFKDKLGQGGYGSVFKGKLPDGCLVAVKVLTNSKGNGAEFINEVASISRTSHVNIVTLLGFCFDGSKRILIYEFMPNGSLDKYIYKENAAIAGHQQECEKLYQIALGVARGLEYLHRGCNTRILHFDIKPQNILLDENFCPKISDFGLAKICPKRESKISMMDARGTIGYIAPEVFCRNFGGVSHKSDVYSYGMLVLEMIGGRQNPSVVVDNTSDIYFPEWIHKRLEHGEELGLPGINGEEENNLAKKMVLVSLWCIQTDPSNRPPVNRVVEMLQANLESLPIPPRPYLSSPVRAPEISLESSGILSSELLDSQKG